MPTITKIFEKAIYHQLYEYFDSNNLLAKEQYECCTKHSTVYAAIKLVVHTSKEMDKRNTPCAFFILIFQQPYLRMLQKLKVLWHC